MRHKFDICLPFVIAVCVGEIVAINSQLPNTKFNLSDDMDNKLTPKRIVCYFASWTVKDLGFYDIDPNLCSHIIYAMGNITDNGTVTVWDKEVDIEKGT